MERVNLRDVTRIHLLSASAYGAAPYTRKKYLKKKGKNGLPRVTHTKSVVFCGSSFLGLYIRTRLFSHRDTDLLTHENQSDKDREYEKPGQEKQRERKRRPSNTTRNGASRGVRRKKKLMGGLYSPVGSNQIEINQASIKYSITQDSCIIRRGVCVRVCLFLSSALYCMTITTNARDTRFSASFLFSLFILFCLAEISPAVRSPSWAKIYVRKCTFLKNDSRVVFFRYSCFFRARRKSP